MPVMLNKFCPSLEFLMHGIKFKSFVKLFLNENIHLWITEEDWSS